MVFDKISFEMKEEHIKLLGRMYVGWQNCEFGAPEIDPKRPYGNSDAIGDMVEILGIDGQKCPHCGEIIDEDVDDDCLIERLVKLHEETKTALQIVLKTQQFTLGVYECDEYHSNWELVNDS